jgi:transposase
LRRHLILVGDRGRIHRAAAKRLQDAEWLDIEWLPAYAPELNPVEALWSHTKHGDLANFVPDDVQELEDGLLESLCDQYYNGPLKRSFFHTTRLNL